MLWRLVLPFDDMGYSAAEIAEYVPKKLVVLVHPRAKGSPRALDLASFPASQELPRSCATLPELDITAHKITIEGVEGRLWARFELPSYVLSDIEKGIDRVSQYEFQYVMRGDPSDPRMELTAVGIPPVVEQPGWQLYVILEGTDRHCSLLRVQ